MANVQKTAFDLGIEKAKQAEWLVRQGQTEEAAGAYQQAFEKTKDSFYLLKKGDLLVQLGRPDEALDLYRETYEEGKLWIQKMQMPFSTYWMVRGRELYDRLHSLCGTGNREACGLQNKVGELEG